MMQALEPTRDPRWVLTHEGYNVLTENAVESRFALGNGFLGMRASRPVSRGPTWVSWQGFVRWASWPRCYVAGLFDRPNTVPPVPALVPIADWSRVRLVLDDNPQLIMDGEFLPKTPASPVGVLSFASAGTERHPKIAAEGDYRAPDTLFFTYVTPFGPVSEEGGGGIG
jgi:hypothetical protein